MLQMNFTVMLLVLALLPLALACRAGTASESASEAPLIDFTDGRELERWRVVNDGVMGGISSSRIQHDGALVFSGDVSLENQGGFASMRSDRKLDLGGRTKLVLRVRGDGQDYRLRLRTTDEFDVPSYQATFSTSAGEWTEHAFALTDFVPMWRGRFVPSAPELDPESLRSIGLVIADKQKGPFRIELESLRVE